MNKKSKDSCKMNLRNKKKTNTRKFQIQREENVFTKKKQK
jgi:hypothetical protein